MPYFPPASTATVSSISVVSANGMAGTVATATTTPAITLTTTVTGTLQGNGTGISASKVTLTQPATGSTLTIIDGKTLTSSATLTLTGTDGSTLNVGTGGTLGTNAFTSTAYAAAASPTFTGTAAAANLTSSGFVADPGYNYQTPSTGFTITMANTNFHLILDPAGTLATGTITMCAAPVDGQVVDIKISQIITALTVAGNSGQSVKGNPTSAAVGSSFTGIYRATNTTWYF